jgi:iron only hydrogenase large subunit-like protein
MLLHEIKIRGPNKPLIVSECPGWVSYAEKIVGPDIFKFMSKVKSP